jgi:hypothetical protein
VKLVHLTRSVLVWIPTGGCCRGVVAVAESKQVAGYVDEKVARSIAARAQVEDMSVSEFVATACEEKLERDGLEDAATRYRVEERMMELVDDAADRAADRIVEQIEDGESSSIEWGEE